MNDFIQKHRQDFLSFQQNEITEHHVYQILSKHARGEHNQKTLQHIADVEMEHYHFWKRYTNTDVSPRASSLRFYPILARLFGVTFAIKLLESKEEEAEQKYRTLAKTIPEVQRMVDDEEKREKEIIDLLRDPFLEHASSIVLGLNDALVELTGALAGFTFALGNSKIIAVAGFITGIAASFSMAAAEYLSTKSEAGDRNPYAAGAITGGSYLVVVLLLIAPYLTLSNHYIALALMLIEVLAIIIAFSYYMSVARDLSLRKQVIEMAVISLGAALLTFLVAVFIRDALGISV